MTDRRCARDSDHEVLLREPELPRRDALAGLRAHVVPDPTMPPPPEIPPLPMDEPPPPDVEDPPPPTPPAPVRDPPASPRPPLN